MGLHGACLMSSRQFQFAFSPFFHGGLRFSNGLHWPRKYTLFGDEYQEDGRLRVSVRFLA